MFCLTLKPENEKKIKELSYIPVGLGKEKFSNECLTDKKGLNIANKNSNYGEYTFHYWIWKNYLDKINSDWIGFCQYRKFFLNENINEDKISFDKLNNHVIKNVPNDSENYNCILGEQFSVEKFKLMKLLKKDFIKILKSPSVLFKKNKRNIKFHFDIFHGEGHLDSAINLLDNENKKDFLDFVMSRTSFNPHNMFICKKKILIKYYESLFPWLEKCEKIFGFDNLKGYGMKRIYGFLAERYLSYWFLKNGNVKELPILVKDLSDYKDL